MTKEGYEEIEIKPHFGTVNFERRRQLRISTDLPAEYWHIENPKTHPGRLLNASEGGLLLYLPEKMEVGQNLKVRLFIGPILELEPIDAFVQVAWIDLHFGENGPYRVGVSFVNISPEDMDKLRNFLNTLTTLKGPSESHIPSKLLKDLGLSNLGDFPPVPPKPPDQA
jgi:c-di-GMP-binding flagellar brake protein YcgR